MSFLIFDKIIQSSSCKTLYECVDITSNEFDPYNEVAICGSGKEPSDILSENSVDLFSSRDPTFNVSFEFKKHKIHPIVIQLASVVNTDPSRCQWRYPFAFAFEGLLNGQWKMLGNFRGDTLSTRDYPFNFTLEVLPFYITFSTFRLSVTEYAGTGGWTGIRKFDIIGSINFGFTHKTFLTVCPLILLYTLLF